MLLARSSCGPDNLPKEQDLCRAEPHPAIVSQVRCVIELRICAAEIMIIGVNLPPTNPGHR